MLADFIRLWDKKRGKQPEFLAKDLVEFIMNRPFSRENKTAIKWTELQESRPHLSKQLDKVNKPIIDEMKLKVDIKTFSRYGDTTLERERGYAKIYKEFQNKLYTLWEVYELEEKYRKENNIKSIFEETRPLFAIRIKQEKTIIRDLNEQGILATYNSVALMMDNFKGAKRPNDSLNHWNKVNNINPEAIGIVIEKVDREELLKEINSIVRDLNEQGISATLYNVGVRIDRFKEAKRPDIYLTKWCRYHNINPEDRGIVVRRKSSISPKGVTREIDESI